MAGPDFAYGGTVLRVNLTIGEITREPTETYTRRWIGGEGVNQWILFNDVGPGVGALDPANEIVIGSGVLTGTAAPTAGRFHVASKNVLTGGVASSGCGGHFGAEMKFAGYDHIVIKGRRPQPCYLCVSDASVEIRAADHLWGKTTWEVEELIKQELGDRDVQVLSIGPAGENLVKGACLITSRAHAAGRCGIGAVMGSKNLKAIAVRGRGEIHVARLDEFMSLAVQLRKRLASSRLYRSLHAFGTPADLEVFNPISHLTVRNFQSAQWDNAKIAKTNAAKANQYRVRDQACFACPVGCKKYRRITDGVYAGVEGQGYEHGAFSSLMTKLDIDYLPAAVYMNALCNQLGLDVDHAGGTIAWAFECFERGILTKAETGGLELRWGDHDMAARLMKMMASRTGLGDLLAEGSWRAAQAVGRGSEKYAMHIKGQDLEEPLTGRVGYALGVILGCIGGGHLRGAPVCEAFMSNEECERLYGVEGAGDRKRYEGKGRLVAWTETFKGVVDIMGTCVFMSRRNSPEGLGVEDFARLYTAATGAAISEDELMLAGERVANLQKSFNVREGFARQDDRPPERFFEPRASGEQLDREGLERMKDEYYEARGWDKTTSYPTQEKLAVLDLGEVASELAGMGRLGEGCSK